MAYYKVEKGTALFNQLIDFHGSIKKVKDSARELLKTIPNANIDHYYMDAEIAGGISFVKFQRDQIPKDWIETKRVQRDKNGVPCYPHGNRKSTKEIRAKIKILPRLNFKDLNEIIGYKHLNYKSNHWSMCPGFIFRKEYVLFDVVDVIKEGVEDYIPVEGMTEILASEYKELSKKENAKQN